MKETIKHRIVEEQDKEEKILETTLTTIFLTVVIGVTATLFCLIFYAAGRDTGYETAGRVLQTITIAISIIVITINAAKVYYTTPTRMKKEVQHYIEYK